MPTECLLSSHSMWNRCRYRRNYLRFLGLFQWCISRHRYIVPFLQRPSSWSSPRLHALHSESFALSYNVFITSLSCSALLSLCKSVYSYALHLNSTILHVFDCMGPLSSLGAWQMPALTVMTSGFVCYKPSSIEPITVRPVYHDCGSCFCIYYTYLFTQNSVETKQKSKQTRKGQRQYRNE